MGRINEDWLAKRMEEGPPKAHSYAYGLPEMADLTTTKHGPTLDVEVQPKWDIPDKVMITNAMTGAFFSKAQNPNHPIEIEEIRDAARSALEAGASGVHFHVRDKNGYNTLDRDRYHDVIDPLKESYPDRIFNGTTIPFNEGDWDTLEAICDDDLFDISPVNPTAVFIGDTVLYEPPDELIARTRLLQDSGIKPQLAVYTDGDIDNTNRYLIETSVVEEPYFWVVIGGLPGTTTMTDPMSMVDGLVSQVRRIREIPGEHVIAVSAAGRASSYLAAQALLLGCHIRVGSEDTIYTHPHSDERIQDNGAEVERFKSIANGLGRELATPAESKALLDID